MKHRNTITGVRVQYRVLPIVLMTMLVLSLVMGGVSALSLDFEVATKLALAGKSSNIAIDGSLSEGGWEAATWYGIAERQVATTMNNTAEFALTWDDNNLYVGVKVVDATVVTENLNDNIYNNDGIEIFIDPNNEKLLGEYDDKVIHLMYQVADGDFEVWGTTDKWTDVSANYSTVTAKHKRTADGYTLEAAFPFAKLGIDRPIDGTVLGIEVTNNDDDNAVSNSADDRMIQYWNESTDAGNPATWGSVCLYNVASPLVSYAGTPTMDGVHTASDGWVFTAESLHASKDINFRLASMCDTKYYYIAIDLYGTDLENAGMNMLFDLDNSRNASGESPKHINHFSFKNNSGDSNQIDSIIKTVAKEDGYTVEIQAPLEALGYDPVYLDTVGIQIEMFRVHKDYTKDRTFWSNSNTNQLWSSTVGYGSMIFNNINVAGGVNNAPEGNQIASYSIAKGESLSGNVTVTDPDGDALTYVLDSSSTQAAASMGTFQLNEATGAWTYTPPTTGDMAGKIANYYIKVTDPSGAYFYQRIEIRVEYAPTYKTYHVDGDTGNDSNDGLTTESALKTIYKAIQKVRPGDTVLIHESDIPYGYSERRGHDIDVSGLPEAYITFKAAEGEKPVINCRNVWNTIRIGGSYIILDGLTVKGQGIEVMNDYAACYNSYKKNVEGTSVNNIPEVTTYNTNGIAVMPAQNNQRIGSVGVDNYKVIHHITVRNCLLDGVAAGGIGCMGCDYVTIENNTILNTCWGDMYACSGISVLGTLDIDDNFDEYKVLVRNNITAGNRHFAPWVSVKRFSDGNGIIIDSTNNKSTNKERITAGDSKGVQPYQSKILVANNLTYLNGGSGIHAFDADNVDLINNTIFSNNMTPSLGYSDFFANTTININMINNIVYAHTGSPANISSASSADVFYDHNLFYNYSSNNNLGVEIQGAYGTNGVIPGENNIYGEDPLFANVFEVSFATDTAYPDTWSTEVKNAATNGGFYIGANYDVKQFAFDFSLMEGSPAIGSGDEQWSQILGNADNRMGAFGTIGSPLMSVTVSDPEPDPEPNPQPDPDPDPEPDEVETPENEYNGTLLWILFTVMSKRYEMIAEAGEGGTIAAPGNPTSIRFNRDITYTITPDSGYEIDTVVVDGENIGAVGSYTFENVRRPHSIYAIFKKIS